MGDNEERIRREERERNIAKVQQLRSVAKAWPDAFSRSGYQQACDDILAALEDPKPFGGVEEK